MRLLVTTKNCYLAGINNIVGANYGELLVDGGWKDCIFVVKEYPMQLFSVVFSLSILRNADTRDTHIQLELRS